MCEYKNYEVYVYEEQGISAKTGNYRADVRDRRINNDK